TPNSLQEFSISVPTSLIFSTAFSRRTHFRTVLNDSPGPVIAPADSILLKPNGPRYTKNITSNMSDTGHIFSCGNEYGITQAPLPLQTSPTSEQHQQLWGNQMALSANIQPHVDSYPDSEQDWQSGQGPAEETGSVISGNPTDWSKGKFSMRSTRESSIAASAKSIKLFFSSIDFAKSKF